LFLKSQLPKLLGDLAEPHLVPVDRLARAEDQLRELETMLTEKSDALDVLQTRFDALAAAKTREQALEIVRPSDEFERSEQLATRSPWSALKLSVTCDTTQMCRWPLAGSRVFNWPTRFAISAIPSCQQGALRSGQEPDGVSNANAVAELGEEFLSFGQANRASALLRESLEMALAIGDGQGEATVLRRLGHVQKRKGDLASAHQLLSEAAVLFERLGDGTGAAETRAMIAELAPANPLSAGPAEIETSHASTSLSDIRFLTVAEAALIMRVSKAISTDWFIVANLRLSG
jgi:hypothetical protein